MIRSARKRHRVTMAAIAVVLPAVFVTGLAVRQSGTQVERLPESIAPAQVAMWEAVLEDDGLFGEIEIHTRIGYSDDLSTAVIELHSDDDLGLPDVLVYWTQGEVSGDGIPPSSVLLGTFDGTGATLTVSRDVLGSGGRLILYSLGHAKVVAISAGIDTQS